MHLVTPTGEECQELFKRIMAKDALNPVRLDFAIQASCYDLIFAILSAGGGDVGTVLEVAGWGKGNPVCGWLQRTFSECVVRLRPEVVISTMTILAGVRTRIGGIGI